MPCPIDRDIYFLPTKFEIFLGVDELHLLPPKYIQILPLNILETRVDKFIVDL